MQLRRQGRWARATPGRTGRAGGEGGGGRPRGSEPEGAGSAAAPGADSPLAISSGNGHFAEVTRSLQRQARGSGSFL